MVIPHIVLVRHLCLSYRFVCPATGQVMKNPIERHPGMCWARSQTYRHKDIPNNN